MKEEKKWKNERGKYIKKRKNCQMGKNCRKKVKSTFSYL